MTTATAKDLVGELKEAKTRLGRLNKRIEKLDTEASAAATNETELVERLERRRAEHVEGDGTLAQVRAAERELEEHRAGGRHLADAGQTLRAELRQVSDTVCACETELARREQQVASESLRREAEELEKKFIDLVVSGIGECLEVRKQLAAEMAVKYPLASAIERLSLDALAGQINQRKGVPPHAHRDTVNMIVRLLLGGVGTASDDQTAKERFYLSR